MPQFNCRGCGCYIHIPLLKDVLSFDGYYSDDEPCCDEMDWVPVHYSERAKKNWRIFKYVTFMILEYQRAHVRIKYMPEGAGYLACKREFEETIFQTNKRQKVC
jgi:hypothetical protein